MVTYGDKLIVRVWAQFLLKMGPISPLIYAVVISPAQVCIIEIVLLGSWQNPHIGSLIHGMWAIFGRKGQVEATRTASTFEKTTPPIKPHSCRDYRACATIRTY